MFLQGPKSKKIHYFWKIHVFRIFIAHLFTCVKLMFNWGYRSHSTSTVNCLKNWNRAWHNMNLFRKIVNRNFFLHFLWTALTFLFLALKIEYVKCAERKKVEFDDDIFVLTFVVICSFNITFCACLLWRFYFTRM